MDEIKSVLLPYDEKSKKGFDYLAVWGKLANVSEEAKSTSAFQFEKTALWFMEFGYRESHEIFCIARSDHSDAHQHEIDALSSNDISHECIKYWQKRYMESSNPLMKARYAELLYKFQGPVTAEKKDREFFVGYIENSFLVLEEDYLQQDHLSVIFLRRVFELNKLSGNCFSKLVKRALEKFEKKYWHYNCPGYWRVGFFMFLKYIDIFTDEEKRTYMGKQHERLTELCSKQSSINAIDNQVDILSQYYTKEYKQKHLEVLNQMYEYLKNCKANLTATEYLYWLKNLRKKFLNAGLKKESEEILVEIRKSSPPILNEMQRVSLEIKLPDDFGKGLERELLYEGNVQTILERFTKKFIPNKEEVRRSLKEDSNEFPLLFLASNEKFDDNGRLIATTKPAIDDIEGSLALSYKVEMDLRALILNLAKSILVEKGFISTENVMDVLLNSCYIERSRLPIIRRGVEAYLQGDYLIAMHLLIPQIEQAIRKMMEMNDGIVLKDKKNAHMLRVLDDMLQDSKIVEVLGEDVSFYFQQLFTSNLGYNMRNDVCHGLYSPEMFNQEKADRVFHALLILGHIGQSH